MIGKLLFLSLLLILCGVYWQWWIPEPKVASDYSLASDQILKSLTDIPRVWAERWSEGLGEYAAFSLWSWPQNLLVGALAHLGLGFSLQQRVMFVAFFLLLGIGGILALADYLKLSPAAKLVSALFYLTNTYIILVVDGGQLSIAFAYAFFPLSFLAVERSITGGWKSRVLAGASTAVLGVFDIRFVYILALLALARFFYQLAFTGQSKRSLILAWLKSGAVVALVAGGLHFYWLLPIVKAPLSQTVYDMFTKSSPKSFTHLGHALFMSTPHWYKNVFGQVSPPYYGFVLIPVLVFLAPILRPKNPDVGFWLLVAVVSAFLVKGPSEPFANLYPWLYSNIPGFSLFRDSSKFFFPATLSFSMLIGVTVEEISRRLASYTRLKVLLAAGLAGYFLLLLKPVWTNRMTGMLSSPPFQKEYTTLAKSLEADRQFSRILWIPSIAPLQFSSFDHPAVEASRFAHKRPFSTGVVGAYETFNFLREAPYTGELFEVAGVGFIAYPFLDARRADLHPDNIRYYYTFLNQITKQPWAEKEVEQSGIPLIKLHKPRERFFLTGNTFLVIGSDDIYKEATKSSKLKLANNGLVFGEERAGLADRLSFLPNAKIILNKKGLTDLASSFIPPVDLIFPAGDLEPSPNRTGWWKRSQADLIEWRYFLQTKYGIDNQDFDLGGGWAVAESSLKLKVKSEKFKRGDILLARVLESSRGGQLKFYQAGEAVGSLDTQKPDSNVRWFEVGLLKNSGSDISLETEGEINVVNSLAVVDPQKWQEYQARAHDLQKDVVSFQENSLKTGSGSVSYRQIDPTRYQVSVANLTEPEMLVFSQTYDPRWKMGSQYSTPVYSFLNGFMVDRDGEYLVEFEPQKYVYPGMWVSGLTLAAVFFILFGNKLRLTRN